MLHWRFRGNGNDPLPDWFVLPKGCQLIASRRLPIPFDVFYEGPIYYLRVRSIQPSVSSRAISNFLQRKSGFHLTDPNQKIGKGDLEHRVTVLKQAGLAHLLAAPAKNGMGHVCSTTSYLKIINIYVWPDKNGAVVEFIEAVNH